MVSCIERNKVSLLSQGMAVVSILNPTTFILRAACRLRCRLRSGTGLPQSPGMLDMRKTTARDLASAFIGEIGALECMAVSACSPLFAVTEARKGFAHGRALIHVDMGIPTVILVAMLILKMDAMWGPVRGWLVR
jgi:hypothetical protein